jgi:hypothetical protein
MAGVYRVQLPKDDPFWQPFLFPGSNDAQDAGCTCPEEQPYPGALDIADDCQVHELERVPS